MTNHDEIFQRLFGQQVYLPFNKRILLHKIKYYLENQDYSADFYFDVFIYENYEELVAWCEKNNKTIQYID